MGVAGLEEEMEAGNERAYIFKIYTHVCVCVRVCACGSTKCGVFALRSRESS